MKLRMKDWVLTGICFSVATAWAQIYTCVDAKGRKITSDRPIAECADREQKELNSNATVKRTVKPVMTADEQRKADENRKLVIEEESRQNEERRRERALLTRYPDRASHDKERTEALAKIDDVTLAANRRISELAAQRKEIDTEMEFYKKDPSKAPFSLKRQIEDNANSVAAQKRFIADQSTEKLRTNTRFDEELAKLRPMWGQVSSAKSSVSVSSAPKK